LLLIFDIKADEIESAEFYEFGGDFTVAKVDIIEGDEKFTVHTVKNFDL